MTKSLGIAGTSGARGILRLEGGQELAKLLSDLPVSYGKKAAKHAMRAGAKVILKATKAFAPVRSGLLRKSLRVKAAKLGKDRIGFQVQTAEGNYKGETFYASFIEYGHHLGRRKLGDKRRWIPARPFMKTAFEIKKYEAVTVIQSELKRWIEAASKRSAGVKRRGVSGGGRETDSRRSRLVFNEGGG